GAVVVLRQQHSVSFVQPGGSGDDFACGAVAAVDDDSRPLQAHTHEAPKAWDLDRPADPLPTREPIYIPAPTPDHRRSDSFERDPSDKPAFREVPPATEVAAGKGPVP